MENKKNYQKILQNTLNSLQKSNIKPKLLLHVCCGPCSTIPLRDLHDYFDIFLLFNNSNIYPYKEYERRKNELIKYIENYYPSIQVYFMDYDNENYMKELEPHKDDKEGHERCRICFRKRLKEGFIFAKENSFEYFGTVMSISRYKNAQDLNRIGLELEKEFSPVKWLCADFKKNNGYEDSLIVIKNANMYFQEYCGCIYSYNSYLKKQKNEACGKKIEEK